ncbi:Peptidase dimerisation domain-containing protein [Streptomyces zhaozhouensis]|uniref:Peptidase dimerisation domain-containing protein n=2 Tax=Streptomyces zhaozhouensis TaxID=1300267 RepID=A0A286DW37_9ACTN|nr:Peptidase dimerisation domain-containing protein [Streptomyces zhaozhouensis]
MTRFATSDTRVNVGTFQAGGGANIIPAHAELTYEVRARANEVLDELNRRAGDIVEGAARMYGVTADSLRYGQAATSVPDPLALRAVEEAAATVPAVTRYLGRASAAGGSDDAHSMITTVQAAGGVGAYLMVGARSVDVPHHHRRFDFDERALGIATDLLEAVFRGSGA